MEKGAREMWQSWKRTSQGGACMAVFGMTKMCVWSLAEVRRGLRIKIFFNHSSHPGATPWLKEVRGCGVGHPGWASGEEEEAEPLTETPRWAARTPWRSHLRIHKCLPCASQHLMKGKMRPDSGLLTRKWGRFTTCSHLQNVFLPPLRPCSSPRRGLWQQRRWEVAWERRPKPHPCPLHLLLQASETSVQPIVDGRGRELWIEYEIKVFKWRASKLVWKFMKLDLNITREPEIQWEWRLLTNNFLFKKLKPFNGYTTGWPISMESVKLVIIHYKCFYLYRTNVLRSCSSRWILRGFYSVSAEMKLGLLSMWLNLNCSYAFVHLFKLHLLGIQCARPWTTEPDSWDN